MIRIPSQATKRFSQPNNSDLFGNLYYTKNVNLDEEGYIKLSSRAVRVYSEEDGGNFDIPIAFGRFADGKFHIVSADKAYNTDINRSSSTLVSQDLNTNTPALDFYTWGCWFQNRWHAVDGSNPSNLVYLSGSTWTDTGVDLTVNVTHVMEVFLSKNALAVANGNTVKLLDTSYSLLLTLTIPSGFEVIGLSFSKNKMAVITTQSSTIAGQNQEAYFFVWDGASTSANEGVGVGSDAIVGVAPYRSSWVILTRTGELKFWNGGGFELLAAFPFYYKDTVWGSAGSKNVYGNAIKVEGEVIYINFPGVVNQYGERDERYIENCPGGVWCFDPKVGLYHRYSPSISPTTMVTVAQADVNTSTDIMTKNSGTIPETGSPVKYVYDRSTPIGGLTVNRVYYVIRHTSTTFSLAATKADAVAGNKVNLTGTGATTNYFLAVQLKDFGSSFSSTSDRVGGVATMNSYDSVYDHLIFGGDYWDPTSLTNDYATLCITVPSFENRGYIVTPKAVAAGLTDMVQALYIKYRPLAAGETIIVKVRQEDGTDLPVSTPQKNGLRCTWTDVDTFTTTADLSAVATHINTNGKEADCEIIDGNGAGQIATISSIALNGSTYTVVLDEELEGITAGSYCDILVNNWEKKGQITSTDTDGHMLIPINNPSKWTQFKVEMRGVAVTIEELVIMNVPQLNT